MASSWNKLAVACGLTMASTLAFSNTPVAGDDWLHVEGNQIVDMSGNPVWLTGANWFGFNTTERVLHGLWSVNLEDTLAAIANRGINILRIPISTELIYEWQNGLAAPAQINDYVNPTLEGATSLEVFDAMVNASRDLGLKILLDVHSAEADNMGHIEPMWYKGPFTPEVFYSTWEWITERYKHDDTIIAFDLENEPHGKPWSDAEFAKWDDSTDVNNWKHACETASNRILDINPNMLIMCEGIESYPIDGTNWNGTSDDDFHNYWWGGNLRGVRDFPVDLGARQKQFMYSPHDYGPAVFQQPWFYPGFNKDTLYADVWKDNWMFIHEENIAPLLIGEWGGFMDGGDNQAWMVAIRDLIIEHGLHHTFWCINPNSGDTGGLLDHSWTNWDEEKYALFEPSLWKNADGKFIGLDHAVALGNAGTGISLNEHFQSQIPSVTIQSPTDNTQVIAGSDVVIQYGLTKASNVNVYVNNTLVGTGPVSGSVTVAAPLTDGLFTVQLQAVDANGVELSAGDSLTLEAVTEILPNPQISITSPSANANIETGSKISVSVTLQDAEGFAWSLGNANGSQTGTTATLVAPANEGPAALTVTALDANQNSLNVSDSIPLQIVAPVPSDIACEVVGQDVWPTGFTLNNVTVTNTGTGTLNSWQVRLTLANSMTFSQGWGGDFTELGSELVVTNLGYNGTLQPGGSVSFGFQGTLSGPFETPNCVAD